MTEEQLMVITEKMESLFQEKWVKPLQKIIDAKNAISSVLDNNQYRFEDHGIYPQKAELIYGHDPFERIDMYLSQEYKFANITIYNAKLRTAGNAIEDVQKFHTFINLFADIKCYHMDNFVSHTWGVGDGNKLLELKKFLEEEAEEYFKVLASLVERGSRRVAGWLDTCSEAEEKASKILMQEFGFGTEVKKSKVLKITVEEVEA